MRLSALALAALSSAAVVPRTPREAPGSTCCFNLLSVGTVNGTVQQNTIGELLLRGNFREGFFCLDTATKRIVDGQDKECFVGPTTLQFRCWQPGIRAPRGDFKFVNNPDDAADPRLYLAYDVADVPVGRMPYLACPYSEDAGAPGSSPSHAIFSQDREERAGCQQVSLVQQDGRGACAATRAR